MERRITIDGLTYICQVTHDDEIEYWRVADALVLADYLKDNGYEVVEVHNDSYPQVWVKRNVRIFNGENYFLNQCEGDLIEWIKDSMVNDFTYYYDKVIFNTEDGFVAAYRDNIKNNWKF